MLSLLKYIIVGTAISATFILTSTMGYLYNLHDGLNMTMVSTLVQGNWPEPPVKQPPARPTLKPALADSLKKEMARIDAEKTIMKTMQIGLDKREERIEIEEKLIAEEKKRLDALKAQLDSLSIASKAVDPGRMDQVTKLVESMRPKQSAPILQNLSDDMIVDMLLRMKEQQAVKILVNLEPARAARITQIISSLN